MRRNKEKLLSLLLECNAIKFGRFKLKNGEESSYFINLAESMKDGRSATVLADVYASATLNFNLDFTFIFGPAYKGIPLAALIASRLYSKFRVNVRWGFDRKEEKSYGDLKESKIVGDLRRGDRVLIVDDVITSGLTKKQTIDLLSSFDVQIVGILVAVDRRKKKTKYLGKIPICSILTDEELLSLI